MRRHDLDVLSLMAGLVFAVLGLGGLLAEATDLDLDAEWVVPMVLVGLGLVGLLGTVLGGRERSTGGVDAAPAEPDGSGRDGVPGGPDRDAVT